VRFEEAPPRSESQRANGPPESCPRTGLSPCLGRTGPELLNRATTTHSPSATTHKMIPSHMRTTSLSEQRYASA